MLPRRPACPSKSDFTPCACAPGALVSSQACLSDVDGDLTPTAYTYRSFQSLAFLGSLFLNRIQKKAGRPTVVLGTSLNVSPMSKSSWRVVLSRTFQACFDHHVLLISFSLIL